ncbi:MAG: hypothetical protein WBE72_25040 [Terracidiphilus sp.]
MKKFGTDREALDFLAGRIAAEAEREAVPLSEIERKMLYFSETEWTLPDMAEVSAEFDRNYDQDEYERKIAGLIRKIEAHSNSGDEQERETWVTAVERLSTGDHYLLVMINSSFSTSDRTVRPPHDLLKLWLTAIGILLGSFALRLLYERLFVPK